MLQEGRRYCIVFEREPGEYTGVLWALDGNPLADARWNEGVPEPLARCAGDGGAREGQAF